MFNVTPTINTVLRRLMPLLGLGLLVLLAACDTLAPEVPTLTPTWEFTGPTLEPSPTVLNLMPTLPPPDAPAPGQNNPLAAALPAHGDMPPLALNGETIQGGSTVQLPLRTGTMLTGTLYQNPPVQLEQGSIQARLPGLLLIGAPSAAWGTFPGELRDAGFTAMVVELEAGQRPNAFVDVINAFSQVPSVNPGLMATIGAGEGANQGMAGCAIELLCDALVMLSPQTEETLLQVQASYNPRPLLLIAAQGDLGAVDTAQALARAATGEVLIETPPGSAQGIDLLVGDPALRGMVIDWLKRVLVE